MWNRAVAVGMACALGASTAGALTLDSGNDGDACGSGGCLAAAVHDVLAAPSAFAIVNEAAPARGVIAPTGAAPAALVALRESEVSLFDAQGWGAPEALAAASGFLVSGFSDFAREAGGALAYFPVAPAQDESGVAVSASEVAAASGDVAAPVAAPLLIPALAAFGLFARRRRDG